MIEFKYILKGLREQKQVSMDKMCEDLNTLYDVALAKSTISKWENGKAEPSLAYARVLTKFFDVTLDYLLGLEKSELYDFTKLSKGETHILDNYNKLNDIGKKEANKRVEELTEMTRYTFTAPITIAAHNDNLTEDEISEMDRRIAEFEKNNK